MYGHIYRKVLFPFFDKVIKRRSVYDNYRRISCYTKLSRDELLERRRRKLGDLLAYCNEHVPFYRDLFEKHGLDTASARDIETVRDLGIRTSKESVRAAGDSILSRMFDKEKLYNSATSGSTGNPVLFYMNTESWCLRTAAKYRAEDWIGKPIGTPTTLIWGHFPDMSARERLKYSLYWRFQNYQFFSAFDIGEESLIRYLSAMKRHGSRFLESLVTAAYMMARVIERKGLEPPVLKGIAVGAERLFDFQKETIEGAFGCPVYNRYGCTEFGNVASECLAREGQHINVDHLWVEVVDGADRPVFDEVGDIVITDLGNYAMPLIRYRIGDRGILTERMCSCGRTFPMLREVIGRVSETLKTKGGDEIHDMYFLWKLSRAPGLVRFQVVQKSYEEIVVKIEHDGSVDRVVTTTWIEDALKDLEQFGVSFRLDYVIEIPLSAMGKMRSFISEIPGAGEQS